MTDIELRNENGTLVGYDNETGEKIPVDFESVDVGALQSNSQTIYVRSDGDDSNDGLSASNAKATPQAAADDAPLHLDGGQALTIDIGSGSFGSLNLSHVAASRSVRVSGATSNGAPATTLDAGGNDSTLVADSCRVYAENLILKNGTYANGYVTKSGSLDMQNCELQGGSITPLNAAADGSSHLKIREQCVFNTDAGTDGGFSHATAVGSEMAVIDASFSGTGVSQGIIGAKQASFVHVNGGTLNADGAANCVRAVDGSDLKLGPRAITFENAGNAVNVARASDVTDKANSGAHTYTSITNKWKVQDASYAEDADGNEAWAAPINSTNTDVTSAFGDGSWAPYLHLNSTDEHWYQRNPISDEWHLGSLRKADSGTVTVAGGGEQNIDTGLTSPANVMVSLGPTVDTSGVISHKVFNTGSNNVMVKFVNDGESEGTYNYTIWKVPTL